MKRLKYYEVGLRHGHEKINHHKLKSTNVSKKIRAKIHANTVIVCHDIFIRHQSTIILVKKETEISSDSWWPISQEITRGLTNEESLQKMVKEKCGLHLRRIVELGSSRIFLSGDPFGHGKGSDHLNLVYFAEGEGELKLNQSHLAVNRHDYEEIRSQLHHYVRDYMDMAIQL